MWQEVAKTAAARPIGACLVVVLAASGAWAQGTLSTVRDDVRDGSSGSVFGSIHDDHCDDDHDGSLFGSIVGGFLGAVLSDTVLLNSPTTTPRDHDVVGYLERAIGVDAMEFGQGMFETSSDVSSVSGAEIVARDAKEYQLANGETISIAQIETVGKALLSRKEELLEALEEIRSAKGYPLAALMVTDIISKGTDLLVSGDAGPVERALDGHASEGVIALPDVMSRKQQVAPKLMSAF